jgi:hypothetical protein
MKKSVTIDFTEKDFKSKEKRVLGRHWHKHDFIREMPRRQELDMYKDISRWDMYEYIPVPKPVPFVKYGVDLQVSPELVHTLCTDFK